MLICQDSVSFEDQRFLDILSFTRRTEFISRSTQLNIIVNVGKLLIWGLS